MGYGINDCTKKKGMWGDILYYKMLSTVIPAAAIYSFDA